MYAQIRTLRWLIKVLTWGSCLFYISLSTRRVIVWNVYTSGNVCMKVFSLLLFVWNVCMKVFSLLLTLHAFLGNCWAERKFAAGTLTTYRCRSTSYRIWENACIPLYIPLAFIFSRLVRTYGSCMHHVQAYMTFFALIPPLKFDCPD
jgi:hypothetical protein